MEGFDAGYGRTVVELGDVVDAFQALRVAFVGVVELGGLGEEEGHEEEGDEGHDEDEDADGQPVLDEGDDGVEHDLPCGPEWFSGYQKA